MNCKKCGFQLNENDQFCKNCGTPVNSVSVQSNDGGLNVQGVGMTNQQQPTSNMQQPNIQQPINGFNQPSMQQSVNNLNQPSNNLSQPGIMQQPVNNVQQSNWVNGYNSQPINQPKQNSGVLKYIIIGIAVAVVVVGTIIGVTIFSNNKKDDNYYGGGVTKRDDYSVNFNNFKLTIPDNMIYDIQDDILLIGDEDETWVVQLSLFEQSFSRLQSGKNQLQSIFQQQNGVSCTPATEKTLGGVNFITMEVSKDGETVLAAYAKANSMYVAGIVAINQDYEADYEILENIAPIISSLEYKPSSSNMSVNTNFNISEFAELVK